MFSMFSQHNGSLTIHRTGMRFVPIIKVETFILPAESFQTLKTTLLRRKNTERQILGEIEGSAEWDMYSEKQI